MAILVLPASAQVAEVRAPATPSSGLDLGLERLRTLVLQHNEAIQMRALEVEIAGKAEAAEKGIFEPQVVASVDHTDSDRPNNTQQRANLGFLAPSTPVLSERNTLYNAGVEFLASPGTRFRLGYTLRELENNLQYSGTDTNRRFYGPEYESFVGLSVSQPLLKNFGPRVTMAKIRLAALASDVAFHEYRRQLMLTLAQAEAAYWDLYLAQERVRIGGESVRLSEKIRVDNQARLEVGRGSELEVLEAQAGVAFRRTRLNEHQQRVIEIGGRLSSLYGTTPRHRGDSPRAVDEPSLVDDKQNFDEDMQQAFVANPDFRIRETHLAQEGIRVKYTRNQRLPQLDLRASYGFNGLGLSPGDSWDTIDSQNHPVWTIGAELRVPIWGGVKERNDHRAAQIARERAIIGLREIETQIQTGVESARRRLNLFGEDIGNYRAIADFQVRLLQTQLDRLAVGAVESRVVLETEEKRSEAEAAVVESMVLYRRSALEIELIRGTLLQARAAEPTKEELRSRTRDQVKAVPGRGQTVEDLERRAAREFDAAVRPTEAAPSP